MCSTAQPDTLVDDGRQCLQPIGVGAKKIKQGFEFLNFSSCPGCWRSGGLEGSEEAIGGLHEGGDEVPALLFGGGEHGADGSEVLGAGLSAEAAGDFLPQLHHADVGFGLVVCEGHIRIVQELQHVVPAFFEAQEKIVAGAVWLPATPLRTAQRGRLQWKASPFATMAS